MPAQSQNEWHQSHQSSQILPAYHDSQKNYKAQTEKKLPRLAPASERPIIIKKSKKRDYINSQAGLLYEKMQKQKKDGRGQKAQLNKGLSQTELLMDEWSGAAIGITLCPNQLHSLDNSHF